MRNVGEAGSVKALAAHLMRFGEWLRRPELLVFLPAITLASFWLGGERVMILTALGLPMLFAIAGAFQLMPQHELPALDGLALRPQIVRAMDAVLHTGPATGKTTACLVLQFDDAEILLDRYGRAAQTEMLALSAERICTVLRDGDTMARLEGGGIAVALGGMRRLDLETMVQLAARLQAALAAPLLLDAARIYVTVSVGFCLAQRAPSADGGAILDAAQVAADEARHNGPNAIRAYAPEMARKRADRDAYRDELEKALDESQIRPHFQPQVSTDSGAISGFEALARWHHPERGLIPPGEFLAAIDEAGLSERMGEVILYHALAALVAWDAAGLRVPTVSVNFSSSELRNPRLAEKLKWELDRFNLPPQRLSIEILETVGTETDNDVIVHNIAELARIGCMIDMDDFGTGHAAITNIRRFAVRRIKIDRSFVTKVDKDREQQKLVSAILSICEQLGLEAVAEGVETKGEHALLAQLGCSHIQGFLISRPMAFEDTIPWITDYQAQNSKLIQIGHRAK